MKYRILKWIYKNDPWLWSILIDWKRLWKN